MDFEKLEYERMLKAESAAVDSLKDLGVTMTHQKLDEKDFSAEYQNELKERLRGYEHKIQDQARELAELKRKLSETELERDREQLAVEHNSEVKLRCMEELLAAQQMIEELKLEFNDIHQNLPQNYLLLKRTIETIVDRIEEHQKKFGVGNG